MLIKVKNIIKQIYSSVFSFYKNKLNKILKTDKYSFQNILNANKKKLSEKINLFLYIFMFIFNVVKTFFFEIGILLFSFFILGYISVSLYSSKYIYSNINNIPINKVGLVLGTSKYLTDGRQNMYYYYRIRAAYELYQNKKINYILVSGDNRRKNYNEPRQMYKDLMDLGVPKEKIYLDFAGFRTYDSVVRAKEIFNQDTYTVISQRFHNERAIFIAKMKGMNVVGYNANNVRKLYRAKQFPREVASRFVMLIDIITGKHPYFYGDKIYIGEEEQLDKDE